MAAGTEAEFAYRTALGAKAEATDKLDLKLAPAKIAAFLDALESQMLVIPQPVKVTGPGTGGRNLEFVLALADSMPSMPPEAAIASVGTDGIDGSSGVAGAMVDRTTMSRAFKAGLEPPGKYLAANNSFAFFAPLDDTVRLGRTDTNVGDLQVLLID